MSPGDLPGQFAYEVKLVSNAGSSEMETWWSVEFVRGNYGPKHFASVLNIS